MLQIISVSYFLTLIRVIWIQEKIFLIFQIPNLMKINIKIILEYVSKLLEKKICRENKNNFKVESLL